jgi:hypothetical protein
MRLIASGFKVDFKIAALTQVYMRDRVQELEPGGIWSLEGDETGLSALGEWPRIWPLWGAQARIQSIFRATLGLEQPCTAMAHGCCLSLRFQSCVLRSQSWNQRSQTDQPNGTRGSVVFRSNGWAYLYRWYHCTMVRTMVQAIPQIGMNSNAPRRPK